MSQKSARKKKDPNPGLPRRKERRFKTSAAYMTPVVAGIGMVGSLVLGAGVFGLWVIAPPVAYASYLVALGGLGLGVSLWFGQPREIAVSVGDAGLAIEDGREVLRLHWYEMKSLSIEGSRFVVRGTDRTLSFLWGANAKATALLLKEAAERVPGVVDVPRALTEKLPPPDESSAGVPVEGDQLTGIACFASEKAIQFEGDARLCQNCGAVYSKDAVPEACAFCERPLEGRLLRA